MPSSNVSTPCARLRTRCSPKHESWRIWVSASCLAVQPCPTLTPVGGEVIFGAVYRDLYSTYEDELSSDSRRRQVPAWLKRLQIIDSTTITLFSNLIFKGVGRHPKTGKKKGRYQGPCQHPCQRGRSVGHTLHLGTQHFRTCRLAEHSGRRRLTVEGITAIESLFGVLKEMSGDC